MYKLIALDLDETLLTSQKTISQKNLDAIARAQAAGVIVTAATGRSYRGSRHFIAMTGITEVHVINYGGAQITHFPSDRVHKVFPLAPGIIREIIAFSKANNLYVQLYDGDDFFFEARTEEAQYYEKSMGYDGIIADLSTYEFKQAPKALIITERENVNTVYESALAHFKDTVHISKSSFRYVEFNQLGIDKGSAIKLIADEKGIAQHEIIAVGDNSIDAAMIQFAGLGVCVANGTAEMRALADYVCPSNDDDGVAHVINKFIFGEN